jgi:hypothetical protein
LLSLFSRKLPFCVSTFMKIALTLYLNCNVYIYGAPGLSVKTNSIRYGENLPNRSCT